VSYRLCWVAEERSKRGLQHLSHARKRVETSNASFFDFLFPFNQEAKLKSVIKMYSNRGTSRGFGRGGGSWRGKDSSRSRAEPLTPPQPFGPTIDSFNSKTLLIEEDAPTIQDVEYVASYNWLDGKSPIVLVPGQYATCYSLETPFEIYFRV
jgi:hypothetical protein